MRLPSAALSKLASDLRASYWFIPATLVVCSILLALAISWLDRHPDLLPTRLPDGMMDTQVEGARAVLSVIATSIIGVAGVMFSVTIVAVSFASGKYGPRLIGNFMRDRGNQWSLGILISTFVFALIVLREIQGKSGTADVFVPQYALWVAIGMALLAVATMIYFVHHIPETINVSNITADLGHRLRRAVQDHDLHLPDTDSDAGKLANASRGSGTDVCADHPGYVQTVDVTGIVSCAEDCDLHITLLTAPGTFVTENDPIFHVTGKDLDADTRTRISGLVALGAGPTEEQNAAFIAQQLVEMIARALSPGINDPFTAINCLNWLYAGLAQKAAIDRDRRTHPRVDLPETTFSDLLETSFGASLAYAKGDALVLDHMRDLSQRLHTHAAGADRAAVTRFLKKL